MPNLAPNIPMLDAVLAATFMEAAASPPTVPGTAEATPATGPAVTVATAPDDALHPTNGPFQKKTKKKQDTSSVKRRKKRESNVNVSQQTVHARWRWVVGSDNWVETWKPPYP